MIVYLNGRFIPEERAVISIHDRGFLYGDGLFETVRMYNGEPFLWADHSARFEYGCSVLQVRCPLSSNEIRQVVRELAQRNKLREALVRFTLSRGPGLRGYSPRGADHPTFAAASFPPPQQPAAYQAIISTIQVADRDPIAGFKHLNKLPQIVARAEADEAGAHEALLTNSSGFVVEGATTNIFWIERGHIATPPLRGILAGTTRAHVLRLCSRLRIPVFETEVSPDQLSQMDGVFVTSSAAEIMELSHLDGHPLNRSPLVQKLQSVYRSA